MRVGANGRQVIRDRRGPKTGGSVTDLKGNITGYNKLNIKLGTITPGVGGNLTSYDLRHMKIAAYDVHRNETKDKTGRTISKGNVLTELFFV